MRIAAIAIALAACAPPPPPQVPGPPAAQPDFKAHRDPINAMDMAALQRKSHRILGELVAALPGWAHDKVENVELRFGGVGVNAYASCAGLGQPSVTLGDDLLHVMAQLARARAAEEVFSVDATRAYFEWMAAHARKDGELAVPPEGRDDPLRRIDKRKLTRQHELFDEGVAWVIGHELAHHYLNHLVCDGDGGIVAETRHAAQAIVPAFHQVDELAADASGMTNVLRARREQRGALLLLEFFAHMHRIGVPDIVFAFALTHPPAQLRIPHLKGVVASWHLSNGAWPPSVPYPKLLVGDTTTR